MSELLRPMMGLVLTELMTPVVSFSSPQRSLASPSSAMGHARGAKRPVPVHAGSPDVQWWLQAPSGWGGPPVHPGGALDALLRGRDGGRVRAQSTELGAHGTANNSGENSDRTAVFSVSARSKVRISAENRDPVTIKFLEKQRTQQTLLFLRRCRARRQGEPQFHPQL